MPNTAFADYGDDAPQLREAAQKLVAFVNTSTLDKDDIGNALEEFRSLIDDLADQVDGRPDDEEDDDDSEEDEDEDGEAEDSSEGDDEDFDD